MVVMFTEVQHQLSTTDGPNKDAKFHLAHLPSDAVAVKEYGKQRLRLKITTGSAGLEANKTYILLPIGLKCILIMELQLILKAILL